MLPGDGYVMRIPYPVDVETILMEVDRRYFNISLGPNGDDSYGSLYAPYSRGEGEVAKKFYLCKMTVGSGEKLDRDAILAALAAKDLNPADSVDFLLLYHAHGAERPLLGMPPTNLGVVPGTYHNGQLMEFEVLEGFGKYNTTICTAGSLPGRSIDKPYTCWVLAYKKSEDSRRNEVIPPRVSMDTENVPTATLKFSTKSIISGPRSYEKEIRLIPIKPTLEVDFRHDLADRARESFEDCMINSCVAASLPRDEISRQELVLCEIPHDVPVFLDVVAQFLEENQLAPVGERTLVEFNRAFTYPSQNMSIAITGRDSQIPPSDRREPRPMIYFDSKAGRRTLSQSVSSSLDRSQRYPLYILVRRK